MLTHASTPAASSAMSSLPPQVYSTAAAVSAASSKPTVGATGGHNRAVSGLFGAATAGVPAPLAGAALTHLGAISTGQSFELPPSQARYSDLGRHHSFPSIPLPPSAAAAHLRASERDSGSASMQFGMSSNSLSQINMSRSASGQRSGGHTPTDFGLQSPQSPATPVIMPRTPSLEGTYYHSSVMYNPLQHAASSFVSPTAQQQRSSARHFTMPLPLRGPNAPLTPQSQSLSNNPVGQTSTASAVMHAHKAQYDVIVTDLCMPRCSGLQEASLVRELEAACGLPPVPIIAVTSNTLLSDRMACARRDITWFLCKPFTRKDILSVLELIVHERALQPLSLAPLRRSLQLSALSAASTPRYGSSAFPSSLHSSHLANCSVSAPGSELLSPRCPPPFLTMLPAAALHSSPKAERQISITDSGGTSCKSSSHRAPSASPPDGKGASAGAGGASGAACGLSATLFSSPSERSDTGTNDSDSSNDFASPLASRSLMALRSNSGGGGDSTSTCASLQSESSSGTNSNLEFASATAALLSTSSPDSTPTPNATLAIGVQTSLSTAAPSLSSFGGSRRHSRSESGSESGPTSRPLTAFSASGDWPTSSNVTTSVAQARTERPTQQEQAHKHEDE
jgi:CheY-like chemotaxis protein